MPEPKSSDERSRLLKQLAEQDAARTKTLEHLSALDSHPKVIDKHDQAGINSNFEAIRDGRVVVGDLNKKEPRQLAPNEIDRNDQQRLNANVDKIATGEMRVVDPYLVP